MGYPGNCHFASYQQSMASASGSVGWDESDEAASAEAWARVGQEFVQDQESAAGLRIDQRRDGGSLSPNPCERCSCRSNRPPVNRP